MLVVGDRCRTRATKPLPATGIGRRFLHNEHEWE